VFNEFSRYEEDFAVWRQDGYHRVKPETFRYIDFLSDPSNDMAPRENTLWGHQWESFLRVVYCYEVLGKDQVGSEGLLLNIVTGGGKTAVIATLIAWLRIAHEIQKFVLLCPNLIVRDRLEEDFEKGRVFNGRDLLPPWSHARAQDFTLTTLGSGKEGGWASFLGASIILGNIHQFYLTNRSGQSNVSALMNGPEFALFNDEAHNSPAEEYEATLQRISERTVFRLDTTATPDRADGRTPDSDMIYEYTVSDALADAIVKTPVVYQPDIKVVELTYTDAKTGEKRRVEEIDWEEVERKGLSATQWVTDDEPMRQQMAIALKRVQEQETRSRGLYHPILFVIAVCKTDAEKAARVLNNVFKVKTLLVTEDSDEAQRKQARDLGKQQRTGAPYRAVVSVLMLREGWDVPEVGVILLLRKFSSKVYGQQVIGRGLRRVRRPGLADDEPQICAVVDHPKLEHHWLWDIFGSRIRTKVGIDQEFAEEEDLPPRPPKQDIVRPDFVIDVPKEIEGLVEEADFTVEVPPPPIPREDWQGALAQLEYDPTTVEITRVDIDSVIGRELAAGGWTTMHSAPETAGEAVDVNVEFSDEDLRSAIKASLVEHAEELVVEAGYAAAFKSPVYGALLDHVRGKFLNGSSLGLAARSELILAWKMLPEMRRKVLSMPGLVAGIIEYGD
jgi:superfamily II DNA or RNA helicase